MDSLANRRRPDFTGRYAHNHYYSSWLEKSYLNIHAVGTEILNTEIQNKFVSRLFTNISHHLKVAEKNKWPFTYFCFSKIRNDVRKNQILIMNLIVIWEVI